MAYELRKFVQQNRRDTLTAVITGPRLLQPAPGPAAPAGAADDKAYDRTIIRTA